MNTVRAAATLFALSAVLLAADRRVPEKEGSVFGITGVWKKDGKPLRFGNPVNIGDKICVERSGSLTISFKDGTASYSCEREGCADKPPCGKPVSEDDKKTVSGLDRFYAAVLPIIRREGDRLIAAVSRGADISEAVVPLNGNQLDLGPMLSDLAPGAYGARFKPLAPGSYEARLKPVTPDATASASANFQYQQGAPAVVSVPGVKPGLYQVELFNREGSALGMDAWILVSAPATFGRDSESFKQAVAMANNWSASTDARSVRAFLRAYLESLALRQAAQ